MVLMGVNVCDFCFSPVEAGKVCQKCGLSHENYNASAGLLMPGTNLMGKYIIGRALGRGGFGATYMAYSSDRRMPVAIKEFFPTGIAYRGKGEEKISIVSEDKLDGFKKGAARFFEEAKTISKFNTNKNIVSVYEFFHANDTVYYSMEYLDGIDLKGYAAKKGGRITPAEAVTVMKSVCEALVSVHSTGTLHRDISPDNIFVGTNGDVKLIDFGAAKQVISEQSQALSVILKQGFAPMEQYKKDGRQGMWTDLYAVGATIYYSLTGKVPDDAMSRMENPDVVFAPELNVPADFVRIIDKCMRVKIEERYQSALEVIDDLSRLSFPAVPLGDGYVQNVYNGIVSNELDISNTSFNAGVSTIPMSQNVSQYMPSALIPEPEEEEESGIVKGVIAAACAVIMLVMGIITALQIF